MDAKTKIAKRQNSVSRMDEKSEDANEEKLAYLRICYIKSDSDGNLGLHLSRTPWDPYPWISGVTQGSNAEAAGVKTGDCVLEVNGEDLLGQRILDVAKKVRRKESAKEGVTLLLWNSGYEKNNLNPQSLSRFANCLQNIAGLLECPVCFEIIKPPTWQCCHGHLICSNCRSRSHKCPICRVTLGRGRSIISDKLFHFLAQTLGNEDRKATIQKSISTSTPNLVRINERLDSNFKQKAGKLKINKKNTDEHFQDENANYYCPTSEPCDKMKNQQNIMIHLQKSHQIAIVQYYCTAGECVKVKFTDWTVNCLVLQAEMFFIGKMRNPENVKEGIFWLWYMGNRSESDLHFKIVFSSKDIWIGKSVSLRKSVGEVLKLKNIAKFDINVKEISINVE